MTDALRGGLLIFAMLSALGAVPVLLRRLRPASLLMLHAVGLCAGLAVALSTAFQRGDGRPLLGVYVLSLSLVGIGGERDERGRAPARAWGYVAGALSALAFAAEGALLAGASLEAGVIGLSVGVVGFSGGAAVALARRAQRHRVPAQRGQDRALAVATCLAAAGLGLSVAPGLLGRGLWPVLLAAAGGLASAARLPPYLAVTAREGVAALFFALATFFAVAASRPAAVAAELAAAAALLSLALAALSRPLVAGARVVLRALPAAREGLELEGPAIAEGALGVMAPLLDDALLRRPERPRVVVRVAARRLLDAALDRAQKGQSSALRKAGRLGVDIRQDESDVDVEGDPADLAEALCAVLDNALGLRERHPDVVVQVHVRGGPSHVTFEISDDLLRHTAPGEVPSDVDAERPFLSARTDAARRPGLGLGLARARVLVERQGGKLLTRKTPDGSCVQLTLPRRLTRSQVGMA